MGSSSFPLVHIYVMGSIPTARQGRTTKSPIRVLTRLKNVTMMGLTDGIRGLWESWCIVAIFTGQCCETEGHGAFFSLSGSTLVIYVVIKFNKITSNCKQSRIIALSKRVGGNAYIHALIVDPDWFDVECGVTESAVRWRRTHVINYQFMKSRLNSTLTNPGTILPPVCLEWPLFSQLTVGKGWPDAWHSSFTRPPGGAVTALGHTLTNGGAARKKK